MAKNWCMKKKCFKPSDVVIYHDFTKVLHIKHNEKIQSKHFSENVSVNIENYTIYYLQLTNDSDDLLVFDFHSFLATTKFKWQKLFFET